MEDLLIVLGGCALGFVLIIVLVRRAIRVAPKTPHPDPGANHYHESNPSGAGGGTEHGS